MVTLEQGIELVKDNIGDYKIYGSELVSECPFCKSEKHKFYFNIESGLYSCKRASCGAHGHINKLLEQLNLKERVPSDKLEPVEKHKKVLNVDLSKYQELSPNDEIVEYMISRGISYETLVSTGVKKYGRALVFVTNKDNRPVGIHYRTADKRIWAESGSMQYLWNRENLNLNNKRIFITEGRSDGLTLIEMGYENIVSMPNGASSHEWINMEWDLLKNFKEIVLLYDNDKAGKLGLEQAKIRLDFATLLTVDLGKYKDINEAYMQDSAFLYKAISNIKEMQLDGFITLDTVSTEDGVGSKLYSCGISQFDTIMGGIRMGESTLIVAQSGVGKSCVLCNMVKGIISQNEKCGVFSGELTNATLKSWIYSVIGGSESIDLTPHPFRKGEFITTINKERELEIDKKVRGRLWIYDGGKSNGYAMLKNFSALNKRFGVKFFFIDNLSILDMQSKGMGQYESEDNFAKVLAEFCRTHQCHIFLFAHPVKQNINSDADFIDKAGRVKPINRFDQYSVRGSATLVNLAHNIMFLMRAKEWERQFFIQHMRDVYNKSGMGNQFNLTVLPKLQTDFSLFAYLVKNRGLGKTFEDALFGYDSNTRRIYGLLTKEEDLSKEITVEEVDSNEGEQFTISFEQL